MSNRNLLKRVIKGGTARHSRLKVYSVCKGERQLIKDEPFDSDDDWVIEVHCNDLKQLELQDKATALKKSRGG